MPVYEFRCDHCGLAFSEKRSFTDEPVSVCPNCGKEPRRLMSRPSIVFKGSGWYKTDSRSEAQSSRETKAAETSSPTGTETKDTKDTKDSSAESTSAPTAPVKEAPKESKTETKATGPNPPS